MIAGHFPNASLVPIILQANMSDMDLLLLKSKIMEILAPGDIIILSMDLSHYKSPELMEAEDEKTIPALLGLKNAETRKLDIDARMGASLALLLFRDLGAKEGLLLERRDSSFFAGRRIEHGTSYATIIYSNEGDGLEGKP
jgi:AmmeMemoRadiSam system protein B